MSINKTEYREIRDSGLFNTDYYWKQYPDVKASNTHPLEHFLLHGAFEGRNPSEKFDTSFYLSANPDVAAEGINPLIHYIRHGQKEGRPPLPSKNELDVQWQFYREPLLVKSLQIDFGGANRSLAGYSAWQGHFDFGYDLVRNFKPQVTVELGTHLGGSFFALSQGAKDAGAGGKVYGVDTWEGDAHAGFYESRIFQIVDDLSKQHFSGTSFLLRMLFDEALDHFEDGSVDLLHIDGFHSYEAVAHDYRTWLPKLAPNGIILFHDISIQSPGFGVHQFWNELKTQYPHLEFHHSAGLGILFPKGINHQTQHFLNNPQDIKKFYR